jgi:hypothetical protein
VVRGQEERRAPGERSSLDLLGLRFRHAGRGPSLFPGPLSFEACFEPHGGSGYSAQCTSCVFFHGGTASWGLRIRSGFSKRAPRTWHSLIGSPGHDTLR